MADEIIKRDQNFVTALAGVTDDASLEIRMLRVDPATGRLLVSATGGGGGDVSGPGSSTDNAVARWDGASGTDIQNSGVIIDDSNNVTGLAQSTGTIFKATTSMILEETGAGTDTITLQAPASIAASYTLTLPVDDGNNGEVLSTNGSGVLSWIAVTATPGGSDTQVQFNDGGALGGDAGFTYNKTTNTATLDVIQLTNSGLKVIDTNATHYLVITPGSNLTADRIFTITTGDAARTLSMAGNLTIGNDFITAGGHSLTLTTTGTTDVTLPTSGTLATTTYVPTTITVANEATDTTCFLGFFTAATGDLGPKTNVNMTFNSNTGVVTFASSVLTTTDINGGTVDGTVIGGSSAAAGTFTTAVANSFVPNSNSVPSNGMYLPAANTLGWAINSAAELQLTATALSPAVDGGNSLGTTALGWQNLFGNTGFVVNIENGDWVATHTAGILTVGTGDLRVTTAGTNSASVVTVGGTQTLTNKTLTSPTLTTPSAFTTGGNITLAENTAIALDPAGSADGKYTGITITGTAGTTLAFGDLVYLAAADSRWELADADAASTSGDVILAMVVLAAAADGDPTNLLLYGNIRADAAFPALTVGAPAYVSTTAGDIQVAQPSGTDDVIRVVGFALTADELMFNPSQDYITHT